MNSTVSLQWLGQSFFKIHTAEDRIVYIDPWKDMAPGNALFPQGISMDDADYVLITHGHFDHIGDTVALASATTKPHFKIVCNFEIMLYLLSQGVPQDKMQPMNIGGHISLDGMTVSMVFASHSSGIGPFGPAPLIEGGEASGFMITLPNGGTIYHAGDTDVFGDMTLLKERYNPDVALLPIGGIFTMDPEAAALAVDMLQPKVALPMHYGGTFQLPGTKEGFAQAVHSRSPQIHTLTPEAGEVVDVGHFLTHV